MESSGRIETAFYCSRLGDGGWGVGYYTRMHCQCRYNLYKSIYNSTRTLIMMNGSPPVGRCELKTMSMLNFVLEPQNSQLSMATNGLALICHSQDVRWTGVITPTQLPIEFGGGRRVVCCLLCPGSSSFFRGVVAPLHLELSTQERCVIDC